MPATHKRSARFARWWGSSEPFRGRVKAGQFTPVITGLTLPHHYLITSKKLRFKYVKKITFLYTDFYGKPPSEIFRFELLFVSSDGTAISPRKAQGSSQERRVWGVKMNRSERQLMRITGQKPLEMVTFCVYGRYIMIYLYIMYTNVYECIPLVF